MSTDNTYSYTGILKDYKPINIDLNSTYERKVAYILGLFSEIISEFSKSGIKKEYIDRFIKHSKIRLVHRSKDRFSFSLIYKSYESAMHNFTVNEINDVKYRLRGIMRLYQKSEYLDLIIYSGDNNIQVKPLAQGKMLEKEGDTIVLSPGILEEIYAFTGKQSELTKLIRFIGILDIIYVVYTHFNGLDCSARLEKIVLENQVYLVKQSLNISVFRVNSAENLAVKLQPDSPEYSRVVAKYRFICSFSNQSV